MRSVTIRRTVVVIGATAALLAVVTLAFLEWRWRRRFDVPYPALAAVSDGSTIARGEYLVYGAAACAYCHVPREEWPDPRSRRAPAAHGTPPVQAAVRRHLFREPDAGSRHRHRAAHRRRPGACPHARSPGGWPCGVSDHGDPPGGRRPRRGDLVPAVAPPVPHRVPEHRFTTLGKALMAFAIGPSDISPGRPSASPHGWDARPRQYLANHVSSCVACHTDRGEDGALVGPPFAGGQRMDVASDATRVYVTAEPHARCGDEPDRAVVRRRLRGEVQARPDLEGTPMPWGAFARMTDGDLRAIYRYLRTLPPTRHEVGLPVQPKARR